MKDFQPPPQILERVPGGGEGGHEKDWLQACKGGKLTSSNFEYSGPLSETVLRGNLAVRFPNEQLLWDGETIKVTNNEEANGFVTRSYRPGWTI